MEVLVAAIVDTFGLNAAIGVAILGGLSFVASVLDAIWSDDKQPAWASAVIKLLSVNFGKASNDPQAQ